MSTHFSGGHAVVIGVGADLQVTIDDAGAIADQLCDSTRCAYKVDHVRVLTDQNARRGHILSALDWLISETGESDTAIIYFSGHGIELPDFYLVPFGFDSNNLPSTAIAGKELTERLRAIKAQKLLVLLDCCHAGGQAEAKGFNPAPLSPTTLADLANGTGRVIIASSRKDEKSWTGKPYSQFTMAILEGMSGYGAFERDGYARVLDLALYVGRVVPDRTNDTQHPIIKVSDLRDNFAIAWYAGGLQTPKTLPWRAVGHAGSVGSDREQIITWQRMLANYRENMLLTEERISEYVDFTQIPLQLLKNKRRIQENIEDTERKLGIEY